MSVSVSVLLNVKMSRYLTFLTKGWGEVAVGRCHDGVSCAEGNTSVSLEEDIFFPEENKAVIWDWW